MEKATKKTIVEMYKEILALDDVKANAEMVEFLERRIELAEKKKGSSNSKKNKEFAVCFATIENAMRAIGKPAQANEIYRAIGEHELIRSANKVSAMLKKMHEEEHTVNIDRTNPKVTLFSLVTTE